MSLLNRKKAESDAELNEWREANELIRQREKAVEAARDKITKADAEHLRQETAVNEAVAAGCSDEVFEREMEALRRRKLAQERARRECDIAVKNLAEARAAAMRLGNKKRIREAQRETAMRADDVREYVAAEEARAKFWRRIMKRNERIAFLVGPGLELGGALLDVSEVTQAFEREAYRIGGSGPAIAGYAPEFPSLPGARCHGEEFRHNASAIPPLVELIARANEHAMRLVENSPAPKAIEPPPPPTAAPVSPAVEAVAGAFSPEPAPVRRSAAEVAATDPRYAKSREDITLPEVLDRLAQKG